MFPDIVILSLVFAGYLFFCLRRGMTYLHLFQQEEYDSSRFLRLIFVNGIFDKRISILLLVVFVLSWMVSGIITLGLLCASFVVIAVLEKDPRKVSKKKLVMTQRARRIFFIALGLMALMGLWWFTLPLPLLWIVSVQLIPLLLVLANVVLQPWESSVQAKFWKQAHEKLLALDPKVIGITGSYGKTSVKHILGHILKTQAPTLITPGSVNTPMGITRIIREQLEETHKYFVVEMGAYGPGSIERLCRLAPPDVGIITAIGQAHYERFKSLDTVAEAKFELADSVLQNGGMTIVHDSCLRLPYAQKFIEGHRDKFIVCGNTSHKDMDIASVTQRADGIEVQLTWQGTAYTLNMPLFGLHHGQNAALAFAAAASLGIDPENIVIALKSVPQIQHRLEVKKQAGDVTFIDDAFNSNPEGFASALTLLRAMPGRKILITPGMVELGAAHDEEHEKIGKLAGEICDVVLLVLPERVPSFITGFKTTGGQKQILEVRSFSEASAWLGQNQKAGDAVLIENDLPDLYERLPTL